MSLTSCLSIPIFLFRCAPWFCRPPSRISFFTSPNLCKSVMADVFVSACSPHWRVSRDFASHHVSDLYVVSQSIARISKPLTESAEQFLNITLAFTLWCQHSACDKSRSVMWTSRNNCPPQCTALSCSACVHLLLPFGSMCQVI